MKKGWEIKQWKDVLEIRSGRNQTEVEDKNGKYPILGSAGKIMGYAKDYICEEGTTIVGRKGTIDNPMFIEYKFWNVDTAFGLHALGELDKTFLYYFCRNYDFTKLDKGSGRPSLVKTDLLQIPIPLPSLPEQQRIVAILDKAFAAIAKAKANAEQNLKNAKELFESYLQGVFEKKSDGWDEKTLGDIGKVSMCKRVYKDQTLPAGDIPFYKIGTFGKTTDAFITKKLYDEFRKKFSFPKKGDVLISASGTIGRRVKYNGEPAYFQDSNIVWIDNDENQVLNDYLYHFYGACNWDSTKGATISRLYNDNLRRIEIVFPKSLKQQQSIVQKLDTLSIKTKRLEKVYQKKLSNLEELKKSLLQKAFSGEL